MKKLLILFVIIILLLLILPGCNNIILQNTEDNAEQAEGELTETENSPGPAPNYGDGVSDGPGWENTSWDVDLND